MWQHCSLQRRFQIRLVLVQICITHWNTMYDTIVVILCSVCSRFRSDYGCIWKPSKSQHLSEMKPILGSMHYSLWQIGTSGSEMSRWERHVCSRTFNFECVRTNNATNTSTSCGLSFNSWKWYVNEQYLEQQQEQQQQQVHLLGSALYHTWLYYTMVDYTILNYTIWYYCILL